MEFIAILDYHTSPRPLQIGSSVRVSMVSGHSPPGQASPDICPLGRAFQAFAPKTPAPGQPP